MRMIIEVRLSNGETINVIGDAPGKEALKNMAVQNSKKMFADSKYHVLPENDIINFDKWNKDTQMTIQNGGKLYYVSIIYNDLVQSFQIQSAGVKSVYNTIKVKYGINETFFAMIYETNQRVTGVRNTGNYKKSSIALSKDIVRDGCNRRDTSKIDNILNQASVKLETFPGLGEYAADIPLVIGMIRSYFKGNYREVPVGSIIGLIAAIIYFISPVDIIPDVIPVVGQLDDIAVLTWALKQVHDDIRRYEQWLNNNEDIIIG